MSVTLITGGGTDPEVGARAVATAGSIAFTLFQPVTSTSTKAKSNKFISSEFQLDMIRKCKDYDKIKIV